MCHRIRRPGSRCTLRTRQNRSTCCRWTPSWTTRTLRRTFVGRPCARPPGQRVAVPPPRPSCARPPDAEPLRHGPPLSVRLGCEPLHTSADIAAQRGQSAVAQCKEGEHGAIPIEGLLKGRADGRCCGQGGGMTVQIVEARAIEPLVSLARLLLESGACAGSVHSTSVECSPLWTSSASCGRPGPRRRTGRCHRRRRPPRGRPGRSQR